MIFKKSPANMEDFSRELYLNSLKSAKNYARSGIRVFPVWPIRDDQCGCGDKYCRSPGKHPIEALVGDWRRTSTTNEQKIRNWWLQVPDANIATPDFLRIDVDIKKNGLRTWEHLVERYGQPVTPHCFTPSGGEHYYFKPSDVWQHSNKTGRLPPGIDVRGHGTGYTLLPPSNHLLGFYEWELSLGLCDVDVAPLPGWLEEILAPTQVESPMTETAFYSPNGKNAPDLAKFGISELMRATIINGHPDDADRSRIDQSVILALVREGATSDEIKAVFDHYPIGTAGKYAEKGKQADSYLAYSIDQARQYVIRAAGLNKPSFNSNLVNAVFPAVTLDESLPQIDMGLLTKCLHREELGDGELLAAAYGDRLVYDHSRKSGGGWHIWQGHHWRPDTTAEIKLLLSGQIASQYIGGAALLNRQASETQSHGQMEEAERLHNLADAMNSRARLLRKKTRNRNVLDYGTSLLGVNGDVWDAKPYLLPVANGVVNLKTGKLKFGQPVDYLRTVALTEWKGLDEPAPRFEQFVLEIMGLDEEMAAFLQRLFGYGISGLTTEHKFPVFWGDAGRNGKDTLLESIGHVLGPLASPVTKDTVLNAGGRRSSGSAEPHIYDLKGKRITWASESREGSRLDAAQVKLITGGGRLKARPLYGNFVDWEPTHLAMLVTNPRPHAPADDEALWSRILLIPFTQRFVNEPRGFNEHQADLRLKEKLKDEVSGILAWLVRGFLSWQQEGLNPPDMVKDATNEYRKAEDTLSHFVADCCVVDPAARVSASDLVAAYHQWCDELGIRNPMDGRTFGEKMSKRYDRGRTAKGNIYRGIGLLAKQVLV